MFSWEEPLASPSPSLATGLDWMTRAATSRWSFSDWLLALDRDGSSGRTSPECCPSTEDGRLAPSSGHWQTSGTGSLTEFWTLSSSECPSAVVASSLLHILEGGRLPLRYFLSARACAGILRRAAKRGRSLPPLLRTALERVAAIPNRLKLCECWQYVHAIWREPDVSSVGSCSLSGVETSVSPTFSVSFARVSRHAGSQRSCHQRVSPMS